MILFIDTAFNKTILAVKKNNKIFKKEIKNEKNISQVLIEETKEATENVATVSMYFYIKNIMSETCIFILNALKIIIFLVIAIGIILFILFLLSL